MQFVSKAHVVMVFWHGPMPQRSRAQAPDLSSDDNDLHTPGDMPCVRTGASGEPEDRQGPGLTNRSYFQFDAHRTCRRDQHTI